MKIPLRRGAKVDGNRLSRWAGPFITYRDSVDEPKINRWIDQFRRHDRDLAARLLDCVDFITPTKLRAVFRSNLEGLPGWHPDTRKRSGKWRFVSFSTSAGESGDSMIHIFRLANNLSGKTFNELFIYKSELLKEGLTSVDTVVFIDDFSATGDQACQTWNEEIQEIIGSGPNIYLMFVANSINARRRIQKETGLIVISQVELTEKDNIFSTKCKSFSPTEKRTLLRYCKIASPKHPKGYGDCGFLIVFAHNCPNNSISILHVNNNKWHGLFPRHS